MKRIHLPWAWTNSLVQTKPQKRDIKNEVQGMDGVFIGQVHLQQKPGN